MAADERGWTQIKKISEFYTSTIVRHHPIKIAFIGTGNFNKSVLLSNLKKQSGIRLRGICTATGMNAAETGKKGWEPIPVP